VTRSINVAEQIEGIRRQTVAVLDDLLAQAGEFELTDPPAALGRYRQKLRENAYKVLIVGEAKRGKSTLVNALIGRDILPTDVDVATSQVFNIRASEREAYRLRFEDGSVREVRPDDLLRYGSQIAPNAGMLPTADRIIRWIEVDVPIRFLPKGVSILDTPGLGSLYAGHAQITHRFVPEADAVIFVLESGQPVVDEDLKFIEQILTVTRNIFFVQTKIDRYNKQDWQDIQRRNQDILAAKFKGSAGRHSRLAGVEHQPPQGSFRRRADRTGLPDGEPAQRVNDRAADVLGLRIGLGPGPLKQ
jgi:GTPase SAR1 family protein